MIEAKIFKNKADKIFGFEILNHGQDLACAAVTILSFNTVNSIEKFTDVQFVCEVENKEEGGYLFFEIEDNADIPKDAELLLNSMLLGLESIEKEYGESLSITIEEVC